MSTAAKAKVTLVETPSAQMSVATEVTAQDSRGRTFTLKKPPVLAQFRLVEALGGEVAQNQTYMGMVFPLLFITAIDGDPLARPGSKGEVEALIQRLDADGIEAVMTAVQTNFAPPTEDAAKND